MSTNSFGKLILDRFMAFSNNGAMSSSLKPAMPQPILVTKNEILYEFEQIL